MRKLILYGLNYESSSASNIIPKAQKGPYIEDPEAVTFTYVGGSTLSPRCGCSRAEKLGGNWAATALLGLPLFRNEHKYNNFPPLSSFSHTTRQLTFSFIIATLRIALKSLKYEHFLPLPSSFLSSDLARLASV